MVFKRNFLSAASLIELRLLKVLSVGSHEVKPALGVRIASISVFPDVANAPLVVGFLADEFVIGAVVGSLGAV